MKEQAESTKIQLPLHRGLSIRDIVLVTSLDILKAAEEDLFRHDTVGFDSETKPGFVAGVRDVGPDLVQFSTRKRVAYLIPVNPPNLSSTFHNGVQDSLRRIMGSTALTKVGFDLCGDAQQFKRNLNIDFSNTVDLATSLVIPGRPRNLQVGTVMGASEYLRVRFPKPKSISVSNWRLPFAKMTQQQILYAANDALIALEVYDAWMERNRANSSS